MYNAYKTKAYEIESIELEDAHETMIKYKQTGNPELKDMLVMHYLKHVNATVYGMRPVFISNIPIEDFFNQGIIALMECIERYDINRGVATFDTYCYTAIRGAILKYIRKQHWLPNRLWEMRNKISKARKQLEQELFRDPTDAEIAKFLEIEPEKLSECLYQISVVDTLSFEELFEQGGTASPANSLSDDIFLVEGDIEKQQLSKALAKAIESLPPKQKQIIALFYYENLNLKEIGEVLELSQQRISQLRKKALEKLNEAIKEYI